MLQTKSSGGGTSGPGMAADVIKMALRSRKKHDMFMQLNVMHKGMIHPNSPRLMAWDALIGGFICTLMFYVPLRLAFAFWEYDTAYVMYSALVDILSMIDIVVHFRTAYKTATGIVSDPKLVAKHYASTWLVVDLLSAIPFDFLLPSVSQAHRKTIKFLKYFRLPKLLRLARLLRVIRKRAKYYGVMIILLTFLILWHSLSCLWVLLALDCERTPQFCEEEYVWPIYTSTMRIMLSVLLLNDNTPQWIDAEYFSLASSHRAVMDTPLQTFLIFSTLSGMLLLAALLANIASVVDTFNGEGQRFHTKMAKYKKEMEYFGLPSDIIEHVMMHYEYLWMNRYECSQSIRHGNENSS